MLEPGLDRRIAEIRERIARAAERGGHGQNTAVIAVTKTHGPEAPAAAFAAGIVDVGENKVQEALGKMDDVMAPVRWHLIGHLQRNKVKSLDRFTLFHALDSSRLADAIDRFGVERGRPVEVLMQVNPAREETKGGFDVNEVAAEAERLASMSGIVLRGAMTIARLGADESELRETFGAVRETNRILASAGHPATELSMGMSNDYELAVEEGATMVRLGSILFGERGK
ncbi:MAG TPA: YggS family pyridoxal phosphate-dependent enzyme [Gemmatimonadaceae bacterium]|nr:YggS family pyridoxal phosphate-dependent enzyme [Gemmatimonadaceae bacterium]